MYKLLIVDDEDFVVDGLYELITENTELDVYKTYSGRKALHLLQTMQFDMLLSDIKMPGIDGFALVAALDEINSHCRVILLTGYNEFESAYRAICHRNLRYLIKTEPDETILACVRDVVAELDQENARALASERSQAIVERLLPMRRNEALRALLTGEDMREPLQDCFQSLRFTMDANRSFALVLLHIMRWNDNENYRRRTSLMERILEFFHQNAERIHMLTYESCIIGISQLALFVQPKDDDDWESMRSRLCSRLEVLQDQCVRNLQIELSFALERTPGVWSGLAQRYADVNNAFTQRDSQNNVIVRHASDDGFTGTPRMEPEMRLAEQACAQLELKRHDALEALQTLLGTSIFAKTGRDVYLYYQLSIPFLKRCGEEAVKMLAEIPYGRTWHDILEGFIYLTLQAERPRIDDSAKPQLVAQVCRYIDAHLDGDISLSVLSEKAHLNACYLSRVFKQTYGMNLSEYILQARVKKACKLLLDPSMKISEVMAEVGIESASYFACIFKRYMHVSPSDYRKSASL